MIPASRTILRALWSGTRSGGLGSRKMLAMPLNGCCQMRLPSSMVQWWLSMAATRHADVEGNIGLKRALIQSWCNGSIRARRSSRLARPYMARFIVFSRLICPSICPLLHGSEMAFRTASASRRSVFAKRCNAKMPDCMASAIQWAKPSGLRLRRSARNCRASRRMVRKPGKTAFSSLSISNCR